ncbi:MAG: glycosyltransferase family 2 protein [Fimbriimonadia bacterium]
MRRPLAEAVSVIIVNHNTVEDLRRCLQSLPEVPTVVVDNASTDGSGAMVRQEFPRVALVQSFVNRGFGRGCNEVLPHCTTDYALILNPDIEVSPGAIERLVEVMDAHPTAVACGGKLVYPDGSLQPSCARRLTLWHVFLEQSGLSKLFPRSRFFGSYFMTWWDHATTRPVEQVMGACLMLRRGPDGEFLLFDPRFFLYCEDTELCHRLRERGEILYVHDAVFRHALGASGRAARAEMVSLYNRGKELYFLIHRGKAAARACRLLAITGALLRLPLGLVRLEKGRVFLRVLRDCLTLPLGYQPDTGLRPPQ